MPLQPTVKPMVVKAAAKASFETKVRCESITREPQAVRVYETTDTKLPLHDCMRDVQTAVLKFVGSPESHPQVELRLAVLGDAGLEVGKVYRLTLEQQEG